MARRKKVKGGSFPTLIIVLIVALISVFSKEVLPHFSKASVGKENIPVSKLADGEYLLVHYIDVGQGDSTLIETPNGGFVLIDAGTNDCSHKLLSYLDDRNVEYIEYLILTHAHEDHIGSADAVIDNFYVKNIIMTDIREENGDTSRLDKAISDSKKHLGTKVITPNEGDKIIYDGVEFLILSDGEGYNDLNDTSVCLRMEYGKSTFIFTGDATKTVERDIISGDFDISAEVYKCGHHGSSTSSCEDFLNDIDPEIAIISCEKGNGYGHPHHEIMESLEDRGITVYRTDRNGDIILRAGKKSINYVTAN